MDERQAEAIQNSICSCLSAYIEKDKTKVLSFQGVLKKRMIYDIVEF